MEITERAERREPPIHGLSETASRGGEGKRSGDGGHHQCRSREELAKEIGSVETRKGGKKKDATGSDGRERSPN